jgi:hypothetical protein
LECVKVHIAVQGSADGKTISGDLFAPPGLAELGGVSSSLCPEVSLFATDLDLISYLKLLPCALMWRVVHFSAWYLLVLPILVIRSGCQSQRTLELFAILHHTDPTEALGLELRRPPSDSSYCFFHEVDVIALCTVIRDWSRARIFGGAADLDRLVGVAKTLR